MQSVFPHPDRSVCVWRKWFSYIPSYIFDQSNDPKRNGISAVMESVSVFVVSTLAQLWCGFCLFSSMAEPLSPLKPVDAFSKWVN